LGCKKSESQNAIGPTPTENYFPNNEGTNYKYTYERIDSNGQTLGNRISYYLGNKIIGATPYRLQIDSLLTASLSQVDTSFFRTTQFAGVYYYLDTLGFSATIKDSTLASLIPFLIFDTEYLAYRNSMPVGIFWPVFKVNLNYGGALTTLVDVSAAAESMEIISLNLSSGQTNKEALRIKYTMVLRSDSTQALTKSFFARAWLVSNIGPVKWEGNESLVNLLTGGGLDLRDTSSVVKQSLIDYQIK
jgi:hypothetical protein